MDNLLDLARKFDAANTPELREKLRAAIENSTAMKSADQATVNELLTLGEQFKPLIGERYEEFEERYARLVDNQKTYQWPVEITIRAMGLVSPEETGNIRFLYLNKDTDCRTSFRCGCIMQRIASGQGQRVFECDYHIKESAS